MEPANTPLPPHPNSGETPTHPRQSQPAHTLDADQTVGRPLGRARWWTTLRRIAPALVLFLLAPLVAEFLNGNLSISAIISLRLLAPLYGGGVILIREAARRTGRGWPTMLLLGLAFGVVEEGLVMQSLFNPAYADIGQRAGAAQLPGLGVNAWWTLFVLTLHVVWSTAVPIIVVEGLFPGRSTTPWLGNAGLTTVGIVFVLGAVVIFAANRQQERFLASTPQLLGTALTVAALITGAFLVGRRPRPRTHATPTAPRPWLVAAATLAALGLFAVCGFVLSGWTAVGAWAVLFITATVLVALWSQRQRWGAAHQVAMAAAALGVYAVSAFSVVPVMGAKGKVDLIGNTVFALGTLGLLVLLWRTVRRSA